MPYPNSVNPGGDPNIIGGRYNRMRQDQYGGPQGGTAGYPPPGQSRPYLPPQQNPYAQRGGIPSPVLPQSQFGQGRWKPPTPPAPGGGFGNPPVSGTSNPPGYRPPRPPAPSSPPPGYTPPMNNGFRGAAWVPGGGAVPSDLPGGGAAPQGTPPPAGGGNFYQDRWDQLSGIDPALLWANQYNKDNGLAGYGQSQADLVRNLLPPRLLQLVDTNQMTLQGALGRYLEFLKGTGIQYSGPAGGPQLNGGF